MEALSPFEFCVRSENSGEFNDAHVWIKLPTDPIELKELEAVLSSEAAFYIFPDGSGEVNEANFKPGNGLRLQPKNITS